MNQPQSILSNCTSGGCGAKIGPGELSGILQGLPRFNSPNLMVGFDGADDAAVYKLEDGTAVISTADFFSPMTEDARRFGRIAAANAMSDVWAMGAVPVLALNLVCYPQAMPIEGLGEILAGGAEKIAEAGAVLGGGHSIYDKEPKYGLAVTGIANEKDIIRNNTPAAGDALILTKPLGTGIIMAAARAGLAAPEAYEEALACMERLNGYAAQHLHKYRVNACTDITGFGLLAHLHEMAGNFTAKINTDALPLINAAKEYAGEYLLTAAGQRNRNHLEQALGEGFAEQVNALPFATAEIMLDPQTSGGLLISVCADDAEKLLADIRTEDPAAAIIGEILPKGETAFVFE